MGISSFIFNLTITSTEYCVKNSKSIFKNVQNHSSIQ